MEKLHDLIAAMTPAEKQFFRRLSGLRPGDKKYIRLFQLIGKMKVYDEDKLRRQLHDPMMEKNLAANKYMLRQLILRSLRLMHDDADATNQLKNASVEIAILLRKGLFLHALDVIKKSIELSIRYERYEDAHILHKQQVYCLLMLHRFDEVAETAPEMKAKREHALLCCANTNTYYELYVQVLELMKKGKVDRSHEFLRLLHHPMLQSEDQALTYQAKAYYYDMRNVLYRLKGELDKSLEEMEKYYTMYRRYPDITGDDPRPIFNTLHNLTNAYLYRGIYDKFFHYLELFRHLPDMSNAYWKDYIQHRVTINSVLMEVTYYQDTTRYTEGAQKIPGFEAILPNEELEKMPEHHLAILFSMAAVYLGAGQAAKCLAKVNQVLHHRPFRAYRHDVLYAAFIMKMIVYLQKHDPQGFTILLKEFDIFVLQSRMKLDSMHILRDIMVRFSHPLPKKERQQILRQHIGALQELTDEHQEEKAILKNFDYLEWIKKVIA